MDMAYKYVSVNQAGLPVSGVIYSESQDMAWIKLKRAGLRAQSLKFSLGDTINGLAGSEFNMRDLALFYENIGKRIVSGRPIGEGLQSASSFITDLRLKQGALLVGQAISDGKSMSDAMKSAEFPYRDIMAVKASEDHGGVGNALISLGEDTRQRFNFQTKITSIFTTPLIISFVIYVGFYLGALFFVPGVQKMFLSLNLPANRVAMPQKVMFAISDMIAKSIPLSAIAWSLPVIGLYMLHKKGYTRKLGDYIKLWRTIAEKSDMSATWSAFGLLYEAGITPFEAARTVAPSASRPQTKLMFKGLEKAFFAGLSLSESVKKSEFPDYIINAITAAESSGFPIPDEIKAMCHMINDEVDIYVRKFQERMEIVSKIIPGLMLMFFFMGTIGGVMMTAFQNI
jgi:type II secretory pathway component PulF